MQLKNNIESSINLLQNYFQNQTKPVQKRLPLYIIASALSGVFNIKEIVQKTCKINDKSFSGNENSLVNFLDSNNFQVDEKFWRSYLNFLFDSFREKGLKDGDELQINIDSTTIEDKFLILHSSIIFNNINYPLYFSMRIYPKKSGQYNHKLFEGAFMKMLKQLLSKNYNYTIVGDRGFGTLRFIDLCAENGFNFCIRLKANLNITIDEKTQNLREFKGKNEEFEALVKKWKKKLKFVIITEKEQTWFLVHNATKNKQERYKNRFHIEQMFKNFKSDCFNIEKTKIKKYHRIKKLLFIFIFAYSIYLFVGQIIEKNSKLKKKFKNHLELFALLSL